MNTQKLFAYLWLVILCQACNTDTTSESIKQPAGYTRIICDFTRLGDTTDGTEKVKRDALNIFKALTSQNLLEFYTIGQNNNSLYFYRRRPMEYDSSPSEEAAFDSITNVETTKLTSDLNNQARLISARSRKECNSCIIEFIEATIQEFKKKDSVPLRLIILSDMLECCNLAGRTKICIESQADIQNELNKIPFVIDSSLSFAGFKNVRIDVVLSTNSMQGSYAPLFKTFWNTLFKRYGYQKPVDLTASLPDDIQKKLEKLSDQNAN